MIAKVKDSNLILVSLQVVSLQQMGNSRARAVYEANLPDNFRRPQNDSSLESFIRAKYEHKKYIAKEWVPPPLPKVNWEKEIDEEMERQKRKKNKYDGKVQIKLSNVEIPQIPKPKSSSTASTITTSATIPSPQPVKKVESNVDLLVSSTTPDKSDDAFSSFLSGPTPVEKDSTKVSEEESFFNQPAPTEKEKTQLTKDSILALYGQPPVTQQFNMIPQQTYNQFQQVQQAPQAFIPQQQGGIPNFMPKFGQPNYNAFPPQQDTAFFQPAQCFGIQQPQPFMQQQPRTMTTQAQGISVPNPFLQSGPQSINQQFGNLSLTQQPANIVPTNLWP